MDDSSLTNNLVLDGCPIMTPQHYLFSLVQLRTLSQSVYIVAEYGIANHVPENKPVHITELAKMIDFQPKHLKRFMSYLASHDIFKELDGDYFIGTNLSRYLRDDVPGNIRDFIRFQNCRALNLALLDMDYTLKTGEASFEKTHGAPFYSYLSANPDVGLLFDNAMTCFNSPLQNTVSSIYDFSRYRTICEMAGGQGGFIHQILQRYPDILKATLVERKAVLDGILPQVKCDPRFEAVAGDFLKSVDHSADLYIIAQTLHNFGDDEVRIILRNVSKAMAWNIDSRLLVVEPSNSDFNHNEPATVTRSIDLLMLVLFKGKERSPTMWKNLFKECGFEFSMEPVKVPPMFGIYECRLIGSSI